MNERIQSAIDKKNSGAYNCAQSVACAFCDTCGVDDATMAHITGAFGLGMGNMEGTCGALSGAAVVIGMKIHDRMECRKAIKGVMERFKERNGAVICKELKGIGTGKVLRQCIDCVADAAEFLNDTLEQSEKNL